MLQILFMILKILGILLLAVLGIILTVLLLVLFVPLRYQADVAFDGKPQGQVLVSWLLHLLTVRVSYDGNVKVLVKVLWLRLFNKTVWPDEELQNSDELDESDEIEEIMIPVERAETVREAKSEHKPQTSKDQAVKIEKREKVDRSEKVIKSEKRTESVKQETTNETDDVVQKSKVELLIDKVVTAVQTIIKKISETYAKICGKVEAGQEKIDMVRAFFADQENKNTIQLVWKQVKKIICHILPRKIRGRVRFGFEDPATTGQILTYVSPFYGLYAKTLKLEPVFDEKITDGELHIKGHIRVAVLLWSVIRVFLNKNFRKLLKKLMAMSKK